MALLHGDFDSSTSSSMMASRSTRAVQEILQKFSIPRAEVHHFTTPRNFGSTFMRTYERFQEGRKIVGYMAFLAVASEDLALIDRFREIRSMPKMHLSYYEDLCLLIVKIMPTEVHEGAAFYFEVLLLDKLRERVNVLVPLNGVGAATFRGNLRMKEADRAWRPETRNPGDWPSIVLEVGPETIQGLRNDAHFWISHSGGRTKVVILVAIDRASREVKVERWGDVAGQPQRLQRQVAMAQMPYQPRMVQELKYDANQQQILGNLPFTIPADLIYDVVPNGVLPHDFQFSHADLMGFFRYIWEQMLI